jgi:hypothetical protein
MNGPQDPQSGADARAPETEEPTGSFIVNLCALPRASLPEHLPIDLEGLRPFISRRTRDGVHRFYLHVGFFRTLAEAETWLSGARMLYPAAFASEVADTLRDSEQGSLPLADTHLMKVLEVRTPRHADETGDTGTYSVQSEARILAEPSATATPVWPIPAPSSPEPPAKTIAKADVPQKPRATDAWSELIAEVNNNSSSTSGVRHLRVERLKSVTRSQKPSKPRK